MPGLRGSVPFRAHPGGPLSGGTIILLNDNHHWTFERIADWLRDEYGL
jgi:hypothetical protein